MGYTLWWHITARYAGYLRRLPIGVRYKGISLGYLIGYDIRGINPIKEDTIWVTYVRYVSVSGMMGCHSVEI